MIPEARLQEIERHANDAKKWQGEALVYSAVRGFGTDACDLVAEVRRLREALTYIAQGVDNPRAVAWDVLEGHVAALTEESDQKEER